jgi:hypothetical protein
LTGLARQKAVARCFVPLLGLELLAIFAALYIFDIKAYHQALTAAGAPPF